MLKVCFDYWLCQNLLDIQRHELDHGLRTPTEEIAFTARLTINSHSKIFRYDQSIFCLPHPPNFSDIIDLVLHWVSVVRELDNYIKKCFLNSAMANPGCTRVESYKAQLCRTLPKLFRLNKSLSFYDQKPSKTGLIFVQLFIVFFSL